MRRLEIVLLNPIAMPEQHGDWIDLKTSIDVMMGKEQYKRIPLGIKVHIPEGNEAYILPRSSTFEKHGLILINMMGVIDYTYGDEWNFLGYALRDTMIPAGTRICQFRIAARMPEHELIVVDKLPDHFTRRGIGHTGD